MAMPSINAVSLVERSEKTIRKKWVDLKSLTKKKEQKYRKSQKQTGGGPPQPPLLPWEEKVISVLPNPVIEGFHGGTDTFQDNLNLAEPDEQVSINEVDSDGKKSSTSPDLLSRNDMEIAFHNAIVNSINDTVNQKQDTSHSSKTTLPHQLSGKEKRPNKRPFGGRLRNDASCDCSERLNAIEADLLEESKKRNVLLTELCGKLDVIIELKKQKLSILAEQNRLQREESVIGSLWEKSY